MSMSLDVLIRSTLITKSNNCTDFFSVTCSCISTPSKTLLQRLKKKNTEQCIAQFNSYRQCQHLWESPLSPRFLQDSTDVKRVLPVTVASPAHACGGRRVAEEPVLTAFSHVATEKFLTVTQASTRIQWLLPSASSLPVQLRECQKNPLTTEPISTSSPCKLSWAR